MFKIVSPISFSRFAEDRILILGENLLLQIYSLKDFFRALRATVISIVHSIPLVSEKGR